MAVTAHAHRGLSKFTLLPRAPVLTQLELMVTLGLGLVEFRCLEIRPSASPPCLQVLLWRLLTLLVSAPGKEVLDE